MQSLPRDCRVIAAMRVVTPASATHRAHKSWTTDVTVRYRVAISALLHSRWTINAFELRACSGAARVPYRL